LQRGAIILIQARAIILIQARAIILIQARAIILIQARSNSGNTWTPADGYLNTSFKNTAIQLLEQI
jgi:hypothetical protein